MQGKPCNQSWQAAARIRWKINQDAQVWKIIMCILYIYIHMYQCICIYIYIHLFITNVYSCGSIMLQHFIETQSFPEVMELSTGPVFLPAHPFNDRPCATSYVDHARNKPKNCFVSLYACT